MSTLQTTLSHLYSLVGDIPLHCNCGKVCKLGGLVVESEGPQCALGDIVTLYSKENVPLVDAEVIGFQGPRVLLMPLGEQHDIAYGCHVVLSNYKKAVPIGDILLGRVIGPLGTPLDNKGPLKCNWVEHFHSKIPDAFKRPVIDKAFETSVRAIDTFTPIGLGQRMGIFAGSGVGKSTLLGMLAKNSEADINVLALVGERGRELNEFIEHDLGEAGLKKSIVVVATSDMAAPLRVRAAFLATYIAEFFRDCGKNVLFMMDSVTRFAMAQREIGLSLGEPPTTRGYPPSVFGILPKLLERAGRTPQGSITGFYTVLVEGDEFNEPISDAVRSILDGHIVLSRQLATANHFPAIDVLESISRVSRNVCTDSELETTSLARNLLALYRRNEDLITVGAYSEGSNAELDRAVKKHESMQQFLRQDYSEKASRNESFNQLSELLK